MNSRLRHYLTMQIRLGRLTLEEVLEKYPDFEMEE